MSACKLPDVVGPQQAAHPIFFSESVRLLAPFVFDKGSLIFQ
jgi:hypothetical protein